MVEFGRVSKTQLMSGQYRKVTELTPAARRKALRRLKKYRASGVDRLAKQPSGIPLSRFGGDMRFVQQNKRATELMSGWLKEYALSGPKRRTGVMRPYLIRGVGDMGGATQAGTFKVGGKQAPAIIMFPGKKVDVTHFRHERAHAIPRRSGWRLAQIGADPRKASREEARADRMASVLGRNASGYEQMALSGAEVGGYSSKDYLAMSRKLANKGVGVRWGDSSDVDAMRSLRYQYREALAHPRQFASRARRKEARVHNRRSLLYKQ